jgi:hypothetical protein
MPLEPPSLVLDTTRLRPALDVDTDPVDRSDQQSTATLSLMSHGRREGQSAERIVGEKRLVNGTYPHITPVVLRRPLTCPASGHFAARRGPAGPNPMYQQLSNGEGVGRCDWLLVRLVSTFAWT